MVKNSTSSFCNKKGQDFDLLFVVVIALIIAIIAVAGFKVIKVFNDSFQNLDMVTQESKDIAQKVEDRYVGIWDVLFLVLFIFIFIVMVASAFFINTHPIFFIISLLITIVSAMVGVHIANAYSQFESTPNLQAEASQFKIIPYIFQHYVLIIVIIGMASSIALFAKIRGDNG